MHQAEKWIFIGRRAPIFKTKNWKKMKAARTCGLLKLNGCFDRNPVILPLLCFGEIFHTNPLIWRKLLAQKEDLGKCISAKDYWHICTKEVMTQKDSLHRKITCTGGLVQNIFCTERLFTWNIEELKGHQNTSITVFSLLIIFMVFFSFFSF